MQLTTIIPIKKDLAQQDDFLKTKERQLKETIQEQTQHQKPQKAACFRPTTSIPTPQRKPCMMAIILRSEKKLQFFARNQSQLCA